MGKLLKFINTEYLMGKKKVVLSGVQPTGDPQLGNYLGAFKGWVDRQEEKNNYFCIVDLHALTVTPDPNSLKQHTRELAAILLASGITPDKSTLFVQSHVTAHAELCWLLNCVTPMGWLERMTQFKDKSRSQERVSVGLLDYPVLMAGDILLYDADEVPVGDDQKQHVELARDIAVRFNNLYGDTFIIPDPIIPKVAGRVMGLNDPSVKMSKSFSHVRGHAIRILDDPKEIERSFMRAVTDSLNEIDFSDDPARAGVNNLLSIYKSITNKTESEVLKDFAFAKGYGDLKKAVAEVVIDELTPIRNMYEELIDDKAELDRLLKVGAEKANHIASNKLDCVKDKMGLLLP
jgi:tryptophanyl-tRNA synthetase